MSLKYKFILKCSYNIKTRADAFEFHVPLSIQRNYKKF